MQRKKRIFNGYFGFLVAFLLLTLQGFSAEVGVVFKYHYSKDTPLSLSKGSKLYGTSKDSLNFVKAINNLRKSANMITLSENSKLKSAAKAHTNYIIKNNISGHYERDGDDGFTGETPMDRGRAAGYEPIYYYIENLTVGFDNVTDSIDGLMQSIYHRFGFLDFYVNEIGIANVGVVHNYNMGNRSNYNKTIDRNPSFVLWPPDHYRDAQVSFANFESPNPLAGEICVTGGITGNPISIQFNPHSQEIRVNSFKLFKGDREIPLQAELNENTDPNDVFTSKEFAIFPASPLEINTEYKVVFDATIGDEDKVVTWSFTTRNYNYPQYRVVDGGTYRVKKDKTYILHIIPNDCSENMSNFEYTGSADIEYLSLNIVKMTPHEDIHFKTGAIEFDLVISDEDGATSPNKNGANSSNRDGTNTLADVDLDIYEDDDEIRYILSSKNRKSNVDIFDKTISVAVDKVYNTLDINLKKTYLSTDKNGNFTIYYRDREILKKPLPLGTNIRVKKDCIECEIKNMPDRLTF